MIEQVWYARSTTGLRRTEGYQATIREWLLSAEYVLSHGNERVLLCERGIRTFDDEFTRNTLDLNAIPVLRLECSKLP